MFPGDREEWSEGEHGAVMWSSVRGGSSVQYEDRSRSGTGWTRAQCDDVMRVWRGGELLELKGFLSTVPVRMLPMDLPASAPRSPFLLLIFVYLLSSLMLHHLPLSPFQSYSTFFLSRFLSFPFLFAFPTSLSSLCVIISLTVF